MKICFVAHRGFLYLTHAIACNLRKQYGDEVRFSAYTFVRAGSEFLHQQKEIAYDAILLDEDLHREALKEPLDLAYLAELEKTYGIPNLWPYIAVDRVVMFNQLLREYPYNTPHYTHEEMMRLLQGRAKAIIRFFEDQKPDVVVLPMVGSIGAYLMQEVAKKHGVKIVTILPGYLQNKTVVSGSIERFTDVEKLTEGILRSGDVPTRTKEAQALLEAFRAKPHAYYEGVDPKKIATSRAKHLSFLRPKNLWAFWSSFARASFAYANDQHRDDYSTIKPSALLLDRTKRKLRNFIGTDDLYDAITPEKEDFAFYPLQYEPEISILYHAPFHPNQLVLIRQIARSLPIHFKLYVKEHPQMAPYRPRAYYKELKKIPNVKLLRPDQQSFGIIKYAKLILTMTSTVGWEALMLRKPVITFGEQFYNALPMVKHCRQMDLLPDIVKQQLAKDPHDEQALLAYIQAIIEDAAPVDLVGTWAEKLTFEERRKNLEPLTSIFAKKIGLPPLEIGN